MNGKDKCELLKDIRRRMAEEYGLDIKMDDCTHEGDCRGTCPRCDDELRELERQLKDKGIDNIDVNELVNLAADGENVSIDTEGLDILEGDPQVPEENIIAVTEGMPYPMDDIPAGKPAPNTTYRERMLFKECAIAGWNNYIDWDFFDELKEGVQLALVRDPKNQYDRNAVAVALASDYDGNPDDFDMDFIIGYVPRTENELIAQMLDMHWNDVFIAELTTVKRRGTYAERLRMTIYIQSKEEQPEEDRGKLYAMRMDNAGIESLEKRLRRKGSVYFRWGGFPPWKMDLPNEGDKVLFIHENKNRATLYLMYLLAKDEAASPFLDNPAEELYIVDDCCPYALTNIMGPVYLDSDVIGFLRAENISDYQPEGALAKETVERLEEVLAEYKTYMGKGNK